MTDFHADSFVRNDICLAKFINSSHMIIIIHWSANTSLSDFASKREIKRKEQQQILSSSLLSQKNTISTASSVTAQSSVCLHILELIRPTVSKIIPLLTFHLETWPCNKVVEVAIVTDTILKQIA